MFFRILACLLTCFISADAVAQMLELDSHTTRKSLPVVENNVPQFVQPEKKQNETGGLSLRELTENNSAEDPLNRSQEPEEDVVENDQEDMFIPDGEIYKLGEPTLDGSERGGQVIVEVDEQGRRKKAEKIFLFYDDFKISNYTKSVGSCDVRFNILSNLDKKISQIDVKLVWPDLTTTLSFSNVAPNTQTYYNYSLLGNGCYKMDMAPNIIVNRCRVKGMTASECAGKIIWLSK